MQPVKGCCMCPRDRAGGAIGGEEGGELASRLGRRPMLYEGGVKSSSQGLCATPHECQSGDVGRVRPGKAAQAWLCTFAEQRWRGERTGRLRMRRSANAVVCESQGRRGMQCTSSEWHHRRMRPSALPCVPWVRVPCLCTESILTSPVFHQLYVAFQTAPRVRTLRRNSPAHDRGTGRCPSTIACYTTTTTTAINKSTNQQ